MTQIQENKNKEKEALEEILDELRSDFRLIGEHLKLYKDEPERVCKFTNARQRTAKSISDFISMLRDPRYQTLSEKGRRDFALMLQRLDDEHESPRKEQLMIFKDKVRASSKERAFWKEKKIPATPPKKGKSRFAQETATEGRKRTTPM